MNSLEQDQEFNPKVTALAIRYGDALSKIAALDITPQSPNNKRMNDIFRWKNVIAVLHELSIIAKQLPWTELRDAELLALGFKLWDKDSPLRLVPAHLYKALPVGLKLTAIDGEVVAVGQSEIDTDTRLGCIPYGLVGADRREKGDTLNEPVQSLEATDPRTA